MKKKLLLFLGLGILSFNLSAQIVYNMGTNPYNGSPTSGVPTGWTASAVTLNNTFAGTGGSGSFSNSIPSDTYSGASGGGNASLNAIFGVNVTASNGDVSGLSYYEFTITPSVTAQVQITNIDFGLRSTTVGILSYIVRSSVDAFANNLANVAVAKDGIWAYRTNAISLSSAVNTPITIRIYGNNASSSSSPNVRLDDLKITGLGVLPVSLTSFKCLKKDDAIQLDWTTTSEKNKSHFDVLRSSNGEKFAFIGKVNSNEVINYSFSDTNPLSGTNYYQLNQVDFDGEATKSEIVAVASGLKAADMTIFANQSSNEVKLNIFSANKTSGTLNIFDLSGKRIFNKSVELEKGYDNISLAF